MDTRFCSDSRETRKSRLQTEHLRALHFHAEVMNSTAQAKIHTQNAVEVPEVATPATTAIESAPIHAHLTYHLANLKWRSRKN
jgi:hypothetical protein